jgi:transposase
MPERRRKYTPEFKDEAAKMVVETSRPIAETAGGLPSRPGTWVMDLGDRVTEFRGPRPRSSRSVCVIV